MDESSAYLDQVGNVLDWIPDAVVVIDAEEGRIVFANRNAETLLGYPSAELASMKVEELVPERSRATHADHRRRYAAKPVVRAMGTEFELVARRKDGSELAVEISLGPVYLNDRLLVLTTIRARGERNGGGTHLQVGDRISISDDLATARTGTVVELLTRHGRPGYLVRWRNGRESVYYPAAGVTVRRLEG